MLFAILNLNLKTDCCLYKKTRTNKASNQNQYLLFEFFLLWYTCVCKNNLLFLLR